MPIVIETQAEFITRHGGKMIRVGRGTFLLQTGACIQGENEPDLILLEPDPDPIRCLADQRRYHSAWLQLIAADFRSLKLALTRRDAPHFNWPTKRYGKPPADVDRYGQPCGKAALLRLKALADEHKAAIEKIDADLPQNREHPAKAQIEQLTHENAARDAAALSEIESIQL